jgi:hypothetical protein
LKLSQVAEANSSNLCFVGFLVDTCHHKQPAVLAVSAHTIQCFNQLTAILIASYLKGSLQSGFEIVNLELLMRATCSPALSPTSTEHQSMNSCLFHPTCTENQCSKRSWTAYQQLLRTDTVFKEASNCNGLMLCIFKWRGKK